MNIKFSKYSSWEAIKPVHDNYLKYGGSDKNGINWMSYLDLNLRLPELLLMRVDKMSMASVESRVPYLDHNLVELMMGLPEKLKNKK